VGAVGPQRFHHRSCWLTFPPYGHAFVCVASMSQLELCHPQANGRACTHAHMDIGMNVATVVVDVLEFGGRFDEIDAAVGALCDIG